MPNQPPPHLSNPMSCQQKPKPETEIIDLSYPNKSKNEIISNEFNRYGCMGAVFNGRPIICGGFYPPFSFQDCFFVQGDKKQNISMTTKRSFATAVVLKGMI